MTRRLLTSLALVAAGVTAVGPNGPAEAAGEPFACAPGFYQVIDGQLSEFDPVTSAYTTIGPDGAKYNATGLRPADGYIYGQRDSGLIRVDSAGGVTALGSLPIPGGFTGDFGDDGLLHVSSGGKDWYKIDVDNATATLVPAFTVNRYVADVANVAGVFYGVSNSGELWSFDPVSGVSARRGTVAGLPTSKVAYGAAWSTAGNNLYVGRNSGEIYQITGYSTGSPVATHVLTAPSTSSNDGASCRYASPPPGVPDVDGVEPEVQPSTEEGMAALERYREEYVEPEYELSDADIGTGASCPATEQVDRDDRSLVTAASVSEPTPVYQSPFDSSPTGWYITSGSWTHEDGTFRQLNTCGFDYTALLENYIVESFDLSVSFKSVTGVNQGGVIIHQSSVHTRSGATSIDLADGGSTIRWGNYDAAGYYQNVGSAPIDAPATGELVDLTVEVRGDQYTIIFNGATIATATAASASGMVGLVTNQADIAFDEVVLTAMPL